MQEGHPSFAQGASASVANLLRTSGAACGRHGRAAAMATTSRAVGTAGAASIRSDSFYSIGRHIHEVALIWHGNDCPLRAVVLPIFSGSASVRTYLIFTPEAQVAQNEGGWERRIRLARREEGCLERFIPA